MNIQPINYYYKIFVKQLNSIDYFKLLTIVLFCLLPISHKSIEIIRYIFIALSLTRIKSLKNAISSKGSIILCLFILIAISSNISNSVFIFHNLDRPLNWLIAYFIGYISIIHSNDKNTITTSLICLTIIVILQFFYHLFINKIPGRYDAGMNSPNQLAIILLAPLHFFFFKSLKLFKHGCKSSLKLLSFLCITGILYNILLKTGSRTTLLFNTFLLMLLPFFIFNKKSLFFTLSIPIIFITLLIYITPNSYHKRFIDSVINFRHDSSFLERFPIWYSAIKSIKNKPLLGNGLGSFRQCYENHYLEFINKYPNYPYIKTTNNAHNFILHIMSETGLIGFLILLSLFFLAIKYALSSEQYIYLSSILFGSLCGFMMNMNFYIREISTLLMVIIGWIFALQLNKDTTEQQRC